ncbi:hypothetical protein [Leptotrichia hofstadii]|nr:hypothetical protein [Leptotrichia hofstadii]
MENMEKNNKDVKTKNIDNTEKNIMNRTKKIKKQKNINGKI